MNVRQLPILIISLLLITSLSGCASFKNLFGTTEKPVQIVTKPLERTPLDLPMPDPIKSRNITWVIVTLENVEAIFKQLEAKGQTPVLFALTDDGYQELAFNMVDIRNFINSQRNIIIRYKDYYEPKKEPAKSNK